MTPVRPIKATRSRTGPLSVVAVADIDRLNIRPVRPAAVVDWSRVPLVRVDQGQVLIALLPRDDDPSVRIVVAEPLAEGPGLAAGACDQGMVETTVSWACSGLGPVSPGEVRLVLPDGTVEHCPRHDGTLDPTTAGRRLAPDTRVVVGTGTTERPVVVVHLVGLANTALDVVVARATSAVWSVRRTFPPERIQPVVAAVREQNGVDFEAARSRQARERQRRIRRERRDSEPVEATGWSLDATVSRAEAELAALLPVVEGPRPTEAYGSTFFENAPIEPPDRVTMLRQAGWDHRSLAEHEARGALWGHLTVAGDQLRRRIRGEPVSVQVFSDALTAAAVARIAERAAWNPMGLELTLTLVDQWVYGAHLAQQVVLGVPNARQERARLRELLAHAPWVALWLRDHNEGDLRVRLGVRPALEAALVSPAGAVLAPGPAGRDPA